MLVRLDFRSIRTHRAGAARLISPTKTRARIYDRDGVLILDSRSLYGRGDVMRFELAPPRPARPEWPNAR